jgi:hypothetical protein
MFNKLKKGDNPKITVVEDPAPSEKQGPKPDVELAREGVEQHPPMTFKRAMALFSLACLLAAAQIPVSSPKASWLTYKALLDRRSIMLVIHLITSVDASSIHCGRYRRRNVLCVTPNPLYSR